MDGALSPIKEQNLLNIFSTRKYDKVSLSENSFESSTTTLLLLLSTICTEFSKLIKSLRISFHI